MVNNKQHFKILHEAYKQRQTIEHCGEKVILTDYRICMLPVTCEVEHTFTMDNGAKIIVVTTLENE